MKKQVYSFFLLGILLASCGGTPSNPENVFVTFKDYDDSVLYHGKIAYGETASYLGETPIRDSDVAKTYAFQGWDKDLNTPLYENTIFTAVYDELPRQYTVTFLDYDNSLLASVGVNYGEIAKYPYSIPIRRSDSERIEYAFSGWGVDLASYPITGDTTFTAHYEMKEFVFATFNNYDGSFLKKVKVQKGQTPFYGGSTPTRTYSGSDKVYRFSGWGQELTGIFSDTTYIAQFDLLNIYTVTFQNYDGTVLQIQKVVHGDDCHYTGDTPYRPSSTSGDYQYTYTFSGWSSSTENVTSDKTVTACFASKVKVTGKTAIVQHLDQYGDGGDYHNVMTSTYSTGFSTLGYKDSLFYLGNVNSAGETSAYVTAVCGYGATVGSGLMQIYNGSSLIFSATYSLTLKNHSYDSISVTKISVNHYGTDEEAVNNLAVILAGGLKLAFDDAAAYLKRWNLSYIC